MLPFTVSSDSPVQIDRQQIRDKTISVWTNQKLDNFPLNWLILYVLYSTIVRKLKVNIYVLTIAVRDI